MNAYRLLALSGATFFTAVGILIGSVRSAPAQVAAPPSLATPTPQPAGPVTAEKPLQIAPLPPPPKAYAAPTEKKPKDELHRVRTPADDELPSWVPKSGRLTVVDSADLAENLGLVPQGSTKKSKERISVADKLAEASAANASDPIVRGVTWGFSKPHITSHLHRR